MSRTIKQFRTRENRRKPHGSNSVATYTSNNTVSQQREVLKVKKKPSPRDLLDLL